MPIDKIWKNFSPIHQVFEIFSFTVCSTNNSIVIEADVILCAEQKRFYFLFLNYIQITWKMLCCKLWMNISEKLDVSEQNLSRSRRLAPNPTRILLRDTLFFRRKFVPPWIVMHKYVVFHSIISLSWVRATNGNRTVHVLFEKFIIQLLFLLMVNKINFLFFCELRTTFFDRFESMKKHMKNKNAIFVSALIFFLGISCWAKTLTNGKNSVFTWIYISLAYM